MPERIFALVANVPAQREQLQRVFLDAGLIDQLVDEPSAALVLQVDLPDEAAAERLLIASRMHGMDQPIIRRVLKLTKKEVAAAPLLVLSAGGPAAGFHRGHPRRGTTYDERNACPGCGAGLVQTSPLKVGKTELPKTPGAATVGDEILLHESLAEPVAAAGLRGLSFLEVLGRNDEVLPWRQMVVTDTMPPMLASTRGMIRGRSRLEQPCARCGRDGWFDTMHEPFVPAYARASLGNVPDLAWTHELFSTGTWAEPIHGKRWLASRRLVVRPVVHTLFTRLKVKGVRWSPAAVT
jgi:hypothetical protein